MTTKTTDPWRDPDHPGNKIRPRVKCIGCGAKGCITAWGPWCLKCNVPRMERISKGMNELKQLYGIAS